jgi:hypothetical protein
MTVFVCYTRIPYEGCTEPLVVFSTRELAEAWKLGVEASGSYGQPRIAELEVV